MKFVDPVTGIGYVEFADRFRIRSVEIDRVTPVVVVLGREIIFRENAEIISVRPEVVIDHVENDREAEAVRFINECAQVVRLSVEMTGGKEIDAIVAPAE